MVERAKGFTCECGKYHAYAMYVYAHWQDLLKHTCDQCGAKHDILLGHATLRRKGKKTMLKGAEGGK